MSGQFVFGNFLETELLDEISNLADTIHIPVVMSQRIPAFLLGEMEARLVLWDGQNAPEIIGAVVNPHTGYLTVTRGQEDTTSRPWAAGTQVICSLTAEIINAALTAYFDISAILNMNFLKLAGGTLTGPLILDADPVDALGAATKQYADNVIGNKLPLAGGTMLGSINMNTNRILNLPAPVANTEAVRLQEQTALAARLDKVDTDRSGVLSTAGTGTAFTVTNQTGETSYADGMMWSARMHATNLDSATMTLNAISAKPIRVVPGQAIRAHVLQIGMPYDFMYDLASDSIYVKGALNSASRIRAGDLKWSALEADHDDCLLCDARAVSRTTYATLFAAIGTKFGVGDGATTFNLPQQSGTTLVGRDLNGTVAATSALTTTSGLNTTTVASAAGLCIGQYVIGNANVTVGTKIADINGLAVTLSAVAIGTGSATTRFSVFTDPAVTGSMGGENQHTMALQEMVQHDHDVFLHDQGHTHSAAQPTSVIDLQYGPSSRSTAFASSTGSAMTGLQVRSATAGGGNQNKVAASGRGGPLNIMQKSLIANLFIYAY